MLEMVFGLFLHSLLTRRIDVLIQNKIAIVTGASGGIGGAIVDIFLENGAR